MSRSKPSDERRTPRDFFRRMDATYHFDLDICATARNHQTEAWVGPGSWIAEDALAEDCCWADLGSVVWMNPPYSQLPVWLAKASTEAQAHRELLVVCLLPSNTSARWWHTWIWDQPRGAWRPQVRMVVFVDKRLVFGPHTTSAMWPSVVVQFGGWFGGPVGTQGKFKATYCPAR